MRDARGETGLNFNEIGRRLAVGLRLAAVTPARAGSRLRMRGGLDGNRRNRALRGRFRRFGGEWTQPKPRRNHRREQRGDAPQEDSTVQRVHQDTLIRRGGGLIVEVTGRR